MHTSIGGKWARTQLIRSKEDVTKAEAEMIRHHEIFQPLPKRVFEWEVVLLKQALENLKAKGKIVIPKMTKTIIPKRSIGTGAFTTAQCEDCDTDFSMFVSTFKKWLEQEKTVRCKKCQDAHRRTLVSRRIRRYYKQ